MGIIRAESHKSNSILLGQLLKEVLRAASSLPGLCVCGSHSTYLNECFTENAIGIVFPDLVAAEKWASLNSYGFEWLSLAVMPTDSTLCVSSFPWADCNAALSREPPELTIPGAILEIHVFDSTILVLIGEESLVTGITQAVEW